jgi:phthalate 4,5-dioxygenase
MALAQQQQEALTRSGPGTPLGALFRRYWIPALLASELPELDCDPVRVRLLGEDLLAFRDSDGRLGLVEEFCPHRGVSLFFGRNEECGLRCSYHGWKFDVNGQCVDMPSEPEESRFRDKVQLVSYLLIERGGVLWAYMGDPERQPTPPQFEWATVPASHRFVSKRLQECNHLQALEGGIDSSHVSFTHRFELGHDPMHGGNGNRYLVADTRPKFEVQRSAGGLLIGARRNADDEQYYWRITQFVLPWYTLIPPFGNAPIGGHAWVPIDDENCWAWSINFTPERPLRDDERAAMEAGKGIHVRYRPGTFRPLAGRDNDFLIDRESQRNKTSFSGVKGISMQDAALQESMGRIQDRTKEHLGTSDTAIIMARRVLLDAIDIMERGEDPPGLAAREQEVRSASLLLPKAVAFAEGAAEALVARVDGAYASL